MSYLDFIDPGNSGGSVVIPELAPISFKPTVYSCKFCVREFLSEDKLFEHRFSEHPYHRPMMLVAGKELFNPTHVIAKRLSASDIRIAHAAKCWLNGALLGPVELSERIAATASDFLDIRLLGADGTVETNYRIQVEVPSEEDIRNVERLFFELSANGEINISAIERFIKQATPYKTAVSFLDALSQYLYGLLARDQRGNTKLTLEDGRSRFNRAQQGLIGIESELGRVLVEVINFSQNAFNDGRGLDSVPRLQEAMGRFNALPNTRSLVGYVPSVAVNGSFKIPLDVATDQVIDWSLLPLQTLIDDSKCLEVVFRDDRWVPDDRFKVRVLLALAFDSISDRREAAKHARSIRHDTFFGPWAESIVAKYKEA